MMHGVKARTCELIGQVEQAIDCDLVMMSERKTAAPKFASAKSKASTLPCPSRNARIECVFRPLICGDSLQQRK
jgi:hypothetical protein